MARGDRSFSMEWRVLAMVFMLVVAPAAAQSPLSTSFYDDSCPFLHETVKLALLKEILSDWRMGASLLRIMFHDCFVQGCDGSVFLDDTPTFIGEKTAFANLNSLRDEAFNAFDRIKADVENICPGVVSCADILVIVAREAVVDAGGPAFLLELGRRDALTTSKAAADAALPLANMKVDQLTSLFAAKGLSQDEMVALSGAHTFGKARCPTFSFRLYNYNGGSGPDPALDTTYLATLQGECPQGVADTVTVNLDQATPHLFDNSYYSNILVNKGLLQTDQTLQEDSTVTAAAVNTLASNQNQFFSQFQDAIVKMGELSPLTGTAGEIRTNCRVVNSA